MAKISKTQTTTHSVKGKIGKGKHEYKRQGNLTAPFLKQPFPFYGKNLNPILFLENFKGGGFQL